MPLPIGWIAEHRRRDRLAAVTDACLSATSQQKPKDDAQCHRGQKRNDRLVGSKVPDLIHGLPMGVLSTAGGPVHLAARLGCRVAGHRATASWTLPPMLRAVPSTRFSSTISFS